jgi:hypothetical protein
MWVHIRYGLPHSGKIRAVYADDAGGFFLASGK